MSEIVWNKIGENVFQTGVDHGVLYPMDKPGVPWNGLVSVEKASSGGEVESFYFDGIKYIDVVTGEDVQVNVEAFTYPPEFAACIGEDEIIPGMSMGNQVRQTFGMAWRTKIGNDLDGQDSGYILHLLYNATSQPASKRFQTVNDSPELANFQWTLDTVPVLPGMDVNDPFTDPADWMWPEGPGMAGWPMGPDGNTPVPGWKATSYVMVRSDTIDPTSLKNLENHLFGTIDTVPFLPSQFDVMKMLNGEDIGFNYPFYVAPVDPGGGTGGGGGTTYSIRRVAGDTFSGSAGSAYSPNHSEPHGGNYEAYMDPTVDSDGTAAPIVQAGGGELFFPEYIKGDVATFLWQSYYGDPAYDYASVCGYEITFKPVSNSWADLNIELVMSLGDTNVSMEIRKNRLEQLIVSPGGPFFGDTPIPYANIDTTAWLTAKLLPNGDWSLGYAGGTNIAEGNSGTPSKKTLGDPDHTYRGYIRLRNPWAGQVDYTTNPATVTGAVSGMRIKDLYFWVDEPV